MPPPRTAATSVTLNLRLPLEDERTYVILGTRRGGTSMVAGVARALGLDLGDLGQRKNNEDPRFQNQKVERMRETITERNGERAVWGWKYPGAGSYLPDIWATLRNPHLVIVYRDPVAASLSQARFDRPRAQRGDRLSLHESNANNAVNTGLALATDRPSLLVSHERAIADPDTLIDELAVFLGAPDVSAAHRAKILDYIAPGHYKAFDDFFPDAGDTAARGGDGGDPKPAREHRTLGRLRRRAAP